MEIVIPYFLSWVVTIWKFISYLFMKNITIVNLGENFQKHREKQHFLIGVLIVSHYCKLFSVVCDMFVMKKIVSVK